jgi:Ni,Fe-hydrogenase III component G
MDTATAILSVETILKPLAEGLARPEDNRLDVMLKVGQLKEAVRLITTARWGYLGAIIGLDNAPLPASGEADIPTQANTGHLEVIYLFFEGAAITAIRVQLTYEHPVVPTICDIIPSATLYERELMELFGVTVEGTPDPARLVLPDEWPEGVYPLRKSFTGIKPS